MNTQQKVLAGVKKGAKYIERVWKNGKWIYRYKITGKGYKKEAAKYRAQSKKNSKTADYYKQIDHGRGRETELRIKYAKDAERHGRLAAEAERNYANKSLAGIAESTIKRGKQIINDILNPQTTVTITSNLYPSRTKKVIKK